MEESPEVAIIQHASGVMQVIHSFFENASTYFIIRHVWGEYHTNTHSHIFHESSLSPHQLLSWQRRLRTFCWAQCLPSVESHPKRLIY